MAYSKKMELTTLEKMMLIHCRDIHKPEKAGLCSECLELLDYARKRTEKCVFGDNKPVCSQCPVHCYRPAKREDIRKIMKYSGPRMLKRHPILAVRYMYRKKFKSHPDRLQK